MPETRELTSVVEAAKQAADAGDYASAERLLREAAFLQEASVGPFHPDLANTLNNLAVVCEITHKPDDAEQYFRRASAIAAAVLEPNHPFVATSRKNLEDFCKAHGKQIDSPTQPPVAPAQPDAPKGSANLPLERSSSRETPPVASSGWSRPLAIGGLIAGTLLVTFVVAATWLGSNNGSESSPEGAGVSAPGNQTTAGSQSAEAVRIDTPKETTTNTGDPVDVRSGTGDATPTTSTGRQVEEPATLPAPADARTAPASVSEPPLVAVAQLCKEVSAAGPGNVPGDWQCVPPSLPIGPGSLVFYTRLKSPTDTTVQHRWYRGDTLRQAVELRIRANTTAGYRTYSRTAVDKLGAADWRVELRSSDGVLLHEERFVVR